MAIASHALARTFLEGLSRQGEAACLVLNQLTVFRPGD
jgi:hypothetical protein